jgi:energy-coupling factor transport system substrate-specific component
VPPSPAHRRGHRTATRTILTAVALGSAVGVVLIPFNFVNIALSSTMPVLSAISYGVFCLGSLIPLAVLRTPGTGILGSAAAGIVSSLSPYGLMAAVTMIIMGILLELPFLITRYRRFGMPMFLISGTIIGIAICLLNYFGLNMAVMAKPVLVMVLVAQLVSVVIGFVASLLIARALGKAGIGVSAARRTAANDR